MEEKLFLLNCLLNQTKQEISSIQGWVFVPITDGLQ
jgi:hypothetical protein